MEKDLKDILLKDLCARLPYGVKVKTSFDKIDEPIELKSINIKNGTFSVGGEYTTISGISLNTYECKPYLFPLSSMTKEQKREYHQSTSKDIDMLQDVILERMNGKDNTNSHAIAYNGIDWLNAHHFDYRGLIEKGLAIDCTNLNIY